MIKVGIVGISGYSGYETLKILLKHPQVRVTYVGASKTTGPVDEIWPQLKNQTSLICEKFDTKKAAEKCDLIFLAVPHATSMTMTPGLLKAGKTVIDLSGDYRLKSNEDYQKWYGVEHPDSKNLAKAVYGLPELHKEKIKKAKLIANPGCYPTAAILGVAPLLATEGKSVRSIIIDAKSGVSGAGKKVAEQLMYCEVNENFKAYKILQHQHTPEIDRYLSRVADRDISVTFVPHLLPINRGILETIYMELDHKVSVDQVYNVYKKFYKTEPFVRLFPLGQWPELKYVVGTNYCDLGIAVSESGRQVVVISAIDNLIKGAAGQAVQNMNILNGFEESEGLI
ncbi:MAG: N-acetyl-gamma-glutamyl-phosphate reductase [Candidatus Omnitrophica bacterium]|nr:N-acetyl-gamma-glutamyl-phosphate reductase [Candidatus Omnitrophota bacterium]